MRGVILYHPNSDHVGLVEGFVHDYKRFKGRDIERLSVDTREGSEMAELYDITQYPAILVIAEDGSLQQMWQGDVMPLMDDVSAYMYDFGKDSIANQTLSTGSVLS